MLTELQSKEIFAMLSHGAQALKSEVAEIDALNVFPVPDGDTGTNMNLSFQAGVAEMKKEYAEANSFGDTMQAFSKGIMMGARGNSGVILSQLFRGMAQHTKFMETVNGKDFALALERGVEIAYKAVMKPVEGTILTVAKEAAKAAVSASKKTNDIDEIFSQTIKQAEITLAKTPDMLPVLKEVGVVDAGGMGLIVIYKGMYEALTGKHLEAYIAEGAKLAQSSKGKSPSQPSKYQANMDHNHDHGEEYGYCTEFFIKNLVGPVDEDDLRQTLASMGDSLVVVADDDFVKVHVHALDPGSVLSYCLTYGSLHNIKIDNMTEQHEHVISSQEEISQAEAYNSVENPVSERKAYGFISVTNGEGIKEVLLSLGVNEVVFGGQSMNPSTEDMASAVANINADNILILPNNKNIIMAAEQVANVIDDKNVVVVPSKTIPEGIAAMLAFHEDQSVEDNLDVMKDAMEAVVSGQVTYAVRDTQVNGQEIKEGDILGLLGGDIVVSCQDILTCTLDLIDKMVKKDEHEIITIFTGQESKDEDISKLEEILADKYPDMEIEVQAGDQPTYYFIIAVE